ncbi:hypothetical protein [Sinomicrobium sp. M5D2P9]
MMKLINTLILFGMLLPEGNAQDGRTWTRNEGTYPFLSDSTGAGIRVRAISRTAYEAGPDTGIALSTDITLTSVSLLMACHVPLPDTRGKRLTHVHLTTMHSTSFDEKTGIRYGNTYFFYRFHVETDGEEKRCPISFFINRGVVEEIKDGILLKVKYVPPFGATELPAAYYYYRLEYRSG